MILPIVTPRRLTRVSATALLIASLTAAGSLLSSNAAFAGMAMMAAAQTANAGLDGCSSNSGKALYDCVANVLDRMSNEITDRGASQTRSALHDAATRLHAAVNKAQALSAIVQCRALISGALAKVRALGGGYVEGWGGGSGHGVGLEAVANVLGRAAKLIQAKG